MSKLEILARQLSKIAGITVDITIRGEKAFTYSFEGQNEAAETALKNYFANIGTFHADSGYDADCDFTCLFHNV